MVPELLRGSGYFNQMTDALANAFQHVFWLAYFQAYAPGVVAAVLLVLPSVTYISIRAIRERLVPWWYVAVLQLLTLPGLASVIQSGNRVSAQMQSVHMMGMRVAHMVLGQS